MSVPCHTQGCGGCATEQDSGFCRACNWRLGHAIRVTLHRRRHAVENALHKPSGNGQAMGAYHHAIKSAQQVLAPITVRG